MGFVAKTPTVPYTSVSDVEAFFERAQTIAEPKPPKKVDSTWVESYGFQTAHPGAIPSMLRWLGVINDEGESVGLWNDLRVDTTRQTTLERLVREAYKAIFDAVDVEKATARDLRGAFVSAYSIGDPGRQIKCFLALCQQAGIKTAEEAREREAKAKPNGAPKATPRTPSRSGAAKTTTTTTRRETRKNGSDGTGITVTLNVEILAEWTEEQIRDRIATVTRAVESAGAGDS